MSLDLRAQLQKTLGDAYRLQRELGGGGMSRVFVADEVRLDRKVVVKVLSPDLAQGISVDRFEREIRTVAGLQQANIVPVLTAGDTDGLPFYTMPFVDGESLRARLGRGPLSVTEVIGVLRDVSKALAYAHRNGVVHRDIKPDNVLLSEGTAVVTDFGIAKAISAARTSGSGATLTQIGTSIGTPAYMAPEQAAGDPEIDHRADIYSLGAMAYELLSGQPVFTGRTPQRMLAAHMSEAPKPIADFRADLPPQLADLVMQCLAKGADARPQSAADIARVLETITSGSGMQAMPPILLGGAGMFRKALAIYAAAFVVVAILAKAAIVGIGLPDWVFPGSLMVMALGLPVVLWTGYVQRVTRRALTATPTFTPGGSPSTTAHGTIATIALKAAPHVSWYRTARGGMYAFGVFIALIAAFMAMRAFGIGPFGSLVASGMLDDRNRVVLTDFRITSADSSLGRVVSDAVRAGLTQSRLLLVLTPTSVSAALARMQRDENSTLDLALARNLAAREGIKAIVDGDVTGVGSGYIVQLRLVSADSGTEIWSSRETGDGPRGLINAADALSRALREKAGESLRAIHADPPLAEATTASLDALREYTEAYRAHGAGNYPDAVRFAREAVTLDTGFALAWRELASTINDARFGVPARDSAITRAFQLRDRLSERERQAVIGDYYRYGPGRDRAKSIEAYEKGVRLGDYSNTNDLGLMLADRREFAKAESLGLVRIRVEPDRSITYLNVSGWQLSQGKLDAVESTLELGSRNRVPMRGMDLLVKSRIALERGDPVLAELLADSAVSSTSGKFRTDALRESASVFLFTGRVKSADRRLREVTENEKAYGATGRGIADTLAAIRQTALAFGPTPFLTSRLDTVVARSDLSRGGAYLDAARTYATLDRADRANAMLSRYQAEVRDTTLLRDLQPALHDARGQIAIAENRPLAAVAEFRRGDTRPDGPAHRCAGCLAGNLARAFDAAGMADSAIAQIERYLAIPLDVRDPITLNTPLFQERLAELYEAKGDAANAARHYRAFIELWKNADPELQPRVAEARRRLAKLTPVEPRQP